MNKLILSILMLSFGILIMFTGLVNGASLSPATQGECKILEQTCNNCTFVNITKMKYGNDSVGSNLNWAMTKIGVNYNYTFCDTQDIGEYTYTTLGNPDGTTTCNTCSEEVSFLVNPTGVVQTTAQGISSAIFVILMFGLTFLFGYVGFKLSESQNLWVAGIFFLFLSIIMMVYNVWLGVEYSRNWVGNDNSQVPSLIFWIFLTIVTLGFFSWIAFLFINWKTYWRQYKTYLKRKNDFNDEDMELDLE